MPGLPKSYALGNAYPSPFNPTSTIEYQLPFASRVSLRVYNLLGQTVSILRDGNEEAGFKSAVWNASEYASGVYLYRLEASSILGPTRVFSQVKKMVLIK